jgi:hypothetical protein
MEMRLNFSPFLYFVAHCSFLFSNGTRRYPIEARAGATRLPEGSVTYGWPPAVSIQINGSFSRQENFREI